MTNNNKEAGKDFVYYVVYGSNLLKERFMVYIKGGEYQGKEYAGCDDTTEPQKEYACTIPHKRYFAKESARWNGGGVAFLDTRRESGTTPGRAYLINMGQLKNIKHQEGECWYGNEMLLGTIDGIPAVTLTSKLEHESDTLPSCEYKQVIERGEAERKDLPFVEIVPKTE